MSLLPYRMPALVLYNFKGARVNVDLYLELARKIIWYAPRVSANTTSAIFKAIVYQHGSCLVNDFEGRLGRAIDCVVAT